MSTKIYDGYRLPNMSPYKLMQFLQSFRQPMNEAAYTLYKKAVLGVGVEILDRAAAGLLITGFNKLGAAYYTAKEFVREKQKEIKNTGLRNPTYDFSCEVCIMPAKQRLHVMLFTEQREMRDIWKQHPKVKFYGYWNNTDRPDNVSERAWRARGEQWDEVLGESGVPGHSGFAYDFIDKYLELRGDLFGRLSQDIEPFNKRVNHITRDIMFPRYCEEHKAKQKKEKDDGEKKDPDENFIARYFEFNDWLATAAGKVAKDKETDRVASILKKKLVKEDFFLEIPALQKN